MELDIENIDQAVLGLLYLTVYDQCRAWKSMDWDALARLHERGFIEDPVNKAKSVVLTEAGLNEAERIFKSHFVKPGSAAASVRYGHNDAEVSSANGSRGFLCRNAVDGTYFFRVYEAKGVFTDYNLRHEDLEVTISPAAMASFYSVGENRILDHSPEVLGLEQDEGTGRQ